MLSQNQVDDIFKNKLQRPATEFEYGKYKGSSIAQLSTIDKQYKGLNTTNSVADLAQHMGYDPSLSGRSALAAKYGMMGYTGSADQNKQLHGLLSGSTQPQPTPIPPAAFSGTVPGATPQPQPQPQPQQETQPQPAQPQPEASSGSVAQAAESFQPPQEDPILTDTLKQYQGVQNQISDIDNSVASALKNKLDEIAKNGGIVDETQVRSMVEQEQAPLMAKRRELVAQQGNLGKQYQTMLSDHRNSVNDYYKGIGLAQKGQQNAASQALNKKKVDVSEQQNAEKISQNAVKITDAESKQSQNVDLQKQKLDLATQVAADHAMKVTKTAVYDAYGQKVGDKISVINTRKIGSKSPAVGATSTARAVNKSNAANAEGGFGAGAVHYSKAALDGLAKSYNGGAKLTDLLGGAGNSKVAAALKAAIINRAYEMNPNSDPAVQQSTFKAMQDATKKVTDIKNTQQGYEEKAIIQIGMIMKGYTDPVSGKQVAPLIDSAGTNDVQLANKLYVGFKIQTGDTPAVLLSNALVTFTTEYAKVMSGGTGSAAASSDSARQEAQSLISTAMKQGTLKSVLGELQAEMNSSITGYDIQLGRLQDNMSKIGEATSQSSQPISAPDGTQVIITD